MATGGSSQLSRQEAATGLAAVGEAPGITSAPLIVTASPVSTTIATATGTISGGT